MPEFLPDLPSDLAWPLACLLAWALGEWLFRVSTIPRISTYALVGFVFGATQLGVLPDKPLKAMVLLANVAFGLLLFECGYRINWRWFQRNPWMLLTSLLESGATLVGVYLIGAWFGLSDTQALLLATLAIPTSPATVLRVIHESQASGQVVERLIHFSALNCLYAVLAFKTIVGYLVFQSSGSMVDALSSSLSVILASALIGAAFGYAVPALLRGLKRAPADSAMAFVLAVILVVALADSLNLSSIVATLSFGLIARARGIVLGRGHRDFGPLGELLSVFLFVFVAAALPWSAITSGLLLGGLVIVIRLGATTLVTTALARVSGISYRKGALVGLAMAPISAFVILMLEQTKQLGPSLVGQLPALATVVLLMEVLGPMLTRFALNQAGETADGEN